jgi:anti-anti-sigma factor
MRSSLEDSSMELPILELKTPWPLVNVEEENGELVVRFHAEGFLWPSVDEVGQILFGLVEETEGCPFVLDFSNVDYLTGIGIEKLVLLNKKLQTHGGRLTIKNVSPHLVKIFSITGLTQDFSISPAQTSRSASGVA